MGSQTQSEIPVVDFTDANMKPGTDTWLSASRVVRTSLENHGCFLACYDKVGKELCDCIVFESEELFGLPVETKTKNTSDKGLHGYLSDPFFESLGIDDPLTMHGCQKFAQIMWPEGNQRFCERMNKYAKLLGELEQMAMRTVIESYGLDMQRCESLIESNNYLLRCTKYRTHEKDENDVAMGRHTDLNLITILHQLNNVSGLEIKLKGGEWRRVEASHSIFAVMAGDALQVWSNGRIPACDHRVTMNEKRTRYSVGLFSFGGGKMIEIPKELIDEKHPLRYKPTFVNYDYLSFFVKEKIKGTNLGIEEYCGI